MPDASKKKIEGPSDYDKWFEEQVKAGLNEADTPENLIDLEDAMVNTSRDLESYINKDR